METEKDKMLWKEAKKRVGFRNHLMVYIAVHLFFWLVWWFNDFRKGDDLENHGGIPWPLFSMFGWGFGLFWHFAGVYLMGNKVNQVEREYEKLKKKHENH